MIERPEIEMKTVLYAIGVAVVLGCLTAALAYTVSHPNIEHEQAVKWYQD